MTMKRLFFCSVLILALMSTLGCVVQREPAKYFCPRANIVLSETIADDDARTLFAISGNWQASFPMSASDVRSSDSTQVPMSLVMKECSDRRFLCKSVSQPIAGDQAREYLIVVPRSIRFRHEYFYRGTRIVTRRPNIRIVGSDHALATVTIWQTINGKEDAVELTLASDQGVVLMDGLRFSRNDNQQACVLERGYGVFKAATIDSRGN
jgi:hypothetical protein